MDTLTLYRIICISVVAIAAVDFWSVTRRDLMMLQQNSYRNERYTRWFNSSKESSNAGRLGACAALLAMLAYNIPLLAGGIVAVGIMLWQFIFLTTRRYKKPLVMTRRAMRINIVTWLLAVIVTAVPALVITESGLRVAACVAIACIILSPLLMLAANILLKPVEASINRRYYNEARDILASMPDLTVIGVTGSYGKTSTKHYLHRILSEQYDTLMTPGSFNTTLGVIRTVREHLKPYNEIFICEMGAKQPGDIKEICDLVHPSIGIVTAVGEQHLESFKTIENVQRTKFELVDSLPASGLAVVNDDFEFVANRGVSNVPVVRYGVRNTANADYMAEDIRYDADGTRFRIKGPDGYSLELHTRLVGECNISNLVAAVAVARYLNVPDSKIQYAVEHIEQVEHRLNVKRTPGGLTIIDDAFNSNPTGSSMALDVLASFNSGRRILITPGMIELGDKQEHYNKILGEKSAKSADIVIVVGHYNRDAILDGLKSEGLPSDNVYAVDTFGEAQQVLGTIARSGDTVLYENDLPDTFK